jgi:hypothetical protein
MQINIFGVMVCVRCVHGMCEVCSWCVRCVYGMCAVCSWRKFSSGLTLNILLGEWFCVVINDKKKHFKFICTVSSHMICYIDISNNF